MGGLYFHDAGKQRHLVLLYRLYRLNNFIDFLPAAGKNRAWWLFARALFEKRA
jgi:hypothetical protein